LWCLAYSGADADPYPLCLRSTPLKLGAQIGLGAHGWNVTLCLIIKTHQGCNRLATCTHDRTATTERSLCSHTLMIQTNSHSPTNYVYTTCWCPLVHLGASETSSHTIQPPSAKPQLTPTNHPPNTMLSHTKHCAGRLFPQHSQASHTQCSTPCYDAVVHRIAFTPPNSSTTQLRGRVCPVSKACTYGSAWRHTASNASAACRSIPTTRLQHY
jgi:hypothetical protein